MATILVKNLPEDVLKELKRLKVELECRTWAELLAKLVDARMSLLLTERDLKRMRKGAEGFLRLKDEVSSRWVGPPTVVEEVRRARGHGSK